ncbi:hypothetical protein QVD17_13388 [Tagetes erecta]|uniref:Uncharacterized protein n=1 Tax=Tagetes erecta TaxID=13708 RepID=A0AAD8P3D6_TARER|nr:hypothetical protein QVD17_13388 [Tagetes erecta]
MATRGGGTTKADVARATPQTFTPKHIFRHTQIINSLTLYILLCYSFNHVISTAAYLRPLSTPKNSPHHPQSIFHLINCTTVDIFTNKSDTNGSETANSKSTGSEIKLCTESLCELRLISKNDPKNRALIAEAGAIPYLSEIPYLLKARTESDTNGSETSTAGGKIPFLNTEKH